MYYWFIPKVTVNTWLMKAIYFVAACKVIIKLIYRSITGR